MHKRHLEDVALEISQDSFWREKIFAGQYEDKFLITYEHARLIPPYLREAFEKYKLEYYVSKPRFCPESFDKGLIIFKFESKEFADLVRYSANNEAII